MEDMRSMQEKNKTTLATMGMHTPASTVTGSVVVLVGLLRLQDGTGDGRAPMKPGLLCALAAALVTVSLAARHATVSEALPYTLLLLPQVFGILSAYEKKARPPSEGIRWVVGGVLMSVLIFLGVGARGEKALPRLDDLLSDSGDGGDE